MSLRDTLLIWNKILLVKKCFFTTKNTKLFLFLPQIILCNLCNFCGFVILKFIFFAKPVKTSLITKFFLFLRGFFVNNTF